MRLFEKDQVCEVNRQRREQGGHHRLEVRAVLAERVRSEREREREGYQLRERERESVRLDVAAQAR